jgi:hypothetical protein
VVNQSASFLLILTTQPFLIVHAAVYKLFNIDLDPTPRHNMKEFRDQAFQQWRDKAGGCNKRFLEAFNYSLSDFLTSVSETSSDTDLFNALVVPHRAIFDRIWN